MFKKLTLLALSVAALVAFAVPAAAQAEVEVTGVEPGELVTAVSFNTDTTIGSGNSLTCEEVHLVGEYQGNGHIDPIEGTAQPCVLNPFGFAAQITEINATVKLDTGGTGSASFAFKFDVHAIGATNCIEETVNPISVTYTNGTNDLTISGGPLQGTGAGCPTGAEEIHGDFELFNLAGEPAVIHG